MSIQEAINRLYRIPVHQRTKRVRKLIDELAFELTGESLVWVDEPLPMPPVVKQIEN